MHRKKLVSRFLEIFYLTKPTKNVLFLDQKYLFIYFPIGVLFILPLKFLLVHTFSCMFYVRILITGRLSSYPCVPCISTRFNCSALGDVDVNLNLEEMRMWTPVRRAKNPQPAGALKLYCYLLSLALRCLRSAGNLIVWQLIKKKRPSIEMLKGR